MMHGREKSGPAIVAVKPTNEAGRPAEEPVEPRPGAKENADEGGTLRAPSREGASHGLDRVRRAWLPTPRILRFAVNHPRWEPDALIGPVRFCAGAPASERRRHPKGRSEAEEAREGLEDDGPTWLAYSLRTSRGEAHQRHLRRRGETILSGIAGETCVGCPPSETFLDKIELSVLSLFAEGERRVSGSVEAIPTPTAPCD